MKVALILLALAGSVCCFQYPLEYEYRYSGQIAMAMPHIRAQASATGIKAKLTFQMRTPLRGIAKISEIMVGNYNGDLDCVQLRKPLPIHYTPMQVYAEQLEKPFAVNLNEVSGEVMIIPNDDYEFVTNIRKSIVETLRIRPHIFVEKEVRMPEGSLQASYVTEEETIFGRCENLYTMTRLPKHIENIEKESMKPFLKTDVQKDGSSRSGSSSVPELPEEYYRLVKSINFDKCHERVELQHAGVSNTSQVSHGQFDWVSSRSSVSTYLVKGRLFQGFRVERVIVEGDVIVSPFGFKTNRLQAITNKTLTLESVSPIRIPIKLPQNERKVKTWSYEVYSPFGEPQGRSKPWVNYHAKGDKYSTITARRALLGLTETEGILSAYKVNILKLLKEIIQHIINSPTPPTPRPSPSNNKGSVVSSQLHALSEMLRALPVKDVEEIYSKVFGDETESGKLQRVLLVDVTAASGSSAPMKVLIRYMKSQKISHERIGTIFMTLTNSLRNPVALSDLLDFVRPIINDIENSPFLASTVLVNFASTAERLCFNERKHNYSIPRPLYGKEDCKRPEIISKFLEPLRQKAQETEKPYVRAIILQAIANLGAPETLSILQNYARYGVTKDPKVRTIAIYGLTKTNRRESARNQVFETLVNIVEDLREETEVRQAAFAALVSWQPSSGWWQRMARLTWREPSQKMAAFVSLTIETLSKATEYELRHQARYTEFARQLLKPYAPSTKYSYNHVFSRRDPKSKMAVDAEFSFIKSPKSFFPREIYSALTTSFGGFKLDLFELGVAATHIDKSLNQLMDILIGGKTTSARWPRNPRDMSYRHSQEVLADMKKYINVDKIGEQHPEVNVYMRMFDNMHTFFPFNKEVVEKVFRGQESNKFVEQLLKGHKVNVTKYFNPIEVQFFVPTSIGLPLVGSASMPTLNLGNAAVKLHLPETARPTFQGVADAKRVALTFKSNYKLMSKLKVDLQMMVPWSKVIIEAGVESFKEINLPIYGNLTIIHRPEIKNVTFNVAPYLKEKFPVFYAHNIPYTTIKSMDPSEYKNDLLIIALEKDRQPQNHVRVPISHEKTGLSGEIQFDGDTKYPFTRAAIFDFLQKPSRIPELLASPTAKLYQIAFNLDSSKSDTQNISLSLSYFNLQHSEEKSKTGEFPDFSPRDSTAQRLNKLRELSEGEEVKGLSAQVFFNGSEFRKYEALLAITCKDKSRNPNEYKSVAALLANHYPKSDSSPEALCLESTLRTHNVSTFEELREALSSEALKASASGKLRTGQSCKSEKASEYEASMSVSSERKQRLSKELESVCNYDHRNPIIELQTAAVYDQATLKIRKLDQQSERVRNMTSNFASLVEGFAYPHGYYDHLYQGTPNEVSVTAKRPLFSKGYTFQASLPKKHSIITDIRLPFMLTKIVPYNGLVEETGRYTALLVAPVVRNTCLIKKGQVHTYDGVSYKYSPLHCYTVAAQDQNNPHEWVIHTHIKESGEQEVHLLISDGFSIMLSKSSASVNGKEMEADEKKKLVKDSEGNVIVEITKESGFYQADFKGRMVIDAKEKIYLTPSSRLAGSLRGLCGNFNGEKDDDKIGPKGCLYNDMELFKYAWTIPKGQGCDQRKYESEEDKVKDFQKHCEKPNEVRDILMVTPSLVYCYQEVYPVKKIGTNLCVGESTIKRCNSECVTRRKKEVNEKGKCWPKDSAPQELKDAERRGYIDHEITDTPESIKSMHVLADAKCVPHNQ